MTDVPKETLESARGMLQSLAKAAIRDTDNVGLEASILAALNFAYQEGYGDGKEDAAGNIIEAEDK